MTKLVYLLTKRDRAMLLHAKLITLHCMPSEITRQKALQVISKAHWYTDCHLSVIRTYIVMPKLHLVDLLSRYYPTNTQNSNWQSLSLSVLAQTMMALLILVNGVPWWNFSKFTVVHAKIGHVSLTMPLLRGSCHSFVKTWYSLNIYKIWQPFLRYGWGPKI